jgi:hypothetical protein
MFIKLGKADFLKVVGCLKIKKNIYKTSVGRALRELLTLGLHSLKIFMHLKIAKKTIYQFHINYNKFMTFRKQLSFFFKKSYFRPNIKFNRSR